MRRLILTLLLTLVAQLSLSQVTIQGTVTASYDDTAPIADAGVQFFRLDVNGQDTTRVTLGAVRTDQNGRFSYLVVTDIQGTQSGVPSKFALSASYPNPFQTSTEVGLSVPNADNFTIAVYNILGQELARVDQALSAGEYAVHWDGASIPGVYFVVAKAGREIRFIKLIQLQRNAGRSSLRITGAKSQLQANVAAIQTALLAPSLQISVSKPSYQTYVSPVLAYGSQSLSVRLTYIGTGNVSSAKRDTALRQTASQFKNLTASMSKTDAATAMAELLRKQSAFEAAGSTSDGNVWARFADGRMAIFVNNLKPGDTSQMHGTVLQKISRAGAMDAPPSNVPDSKKMYYSTSLGTIFLNSWLGVRYLCEDVGYQSLYASSVDQLKGINDAGVFYANGHGGYGEVPTGGTEYAVWTNTPVTAENDSIYADDLREHRLVYMYGLYDIYNFVSKPPDTSMAWKYAFTGQFVRKYMSFAKNSLVCVGACSSASNSVFVNSFFAKGAAVYAGYTAPAYADYLKTSVEVFFDRTTGMSSVVVHPQENPAQRAFDWPSVLSWMQSTKLDYGADDGSSKFTVIANSGSKLGPLAPSIATMFVHPYDQKLYIYGIFGENPGGDGVVTIGQIPTQIYEWAYDGTSQMDRIVCKIPDDGAGSYGDVQVKVRGIKSNTTQLSRYKGDFSLIHETTDGRQYEVKLTLQFRVHLLGFRMKPGDKPVFNQTTYVVNADMGSKGEWTASGSTAGQMFWGGNGTDLHNNIDGTGSTRGFVAGAWFDPEQKKMQLYMSGGIQDGIIQTVGTQVIPMSIVFGLDEFDGKRDFFPSYVNIPLQADFSISKNSVSAKRVQTYFSVMAPMADKVRIEWGNIRCDAPPKEDARR